ncbi:MAG: LacI family transcriptional regulator [Clostridia bacterium]|jgi:LacI family transcriptional regulator|nr:LacI family transcriptional regulator [Clostridia bacterium]
MNKRVTIKDIARLSGCSVNCVSRALMDAPDISIKTKEKIRRLADEIGYVYNRNAASLRSGKSRTVGILFDNLLNPFYYIMTNYIWEYLHDEGYTIITFKNDFAVFNEEIVRQILSNNVDGLLSFLQPSEAASKLLESRALPTVVLGRNAHGMCDCVFLDDRMGGRLAAANFLSRGFKKPLYLGEVSSLECSLERGKGFAEEFAKHGIQADLQYLDTYGMQKFANYFDELAERNVLPDCIFCFNDYAAYEVMSAMDKRNVKGIAVIGYDNIQKEIFMPGTLTSIDYDKRNMAETAVQLLLKKINGVFDGHPRETLISDLQVSVTRPQ